MDEKTAAVWMKLIATVGRVATVSVVALAIYKCVDALAGQQTNALIEASLEYGNTNYFLLAITLLSSLWAFAERKARERSTKELSRRNRELEAKIDPDRTSSNLLENGKTNPGDKL